MADFLKAYQMLQAHEGGYAHVVKDRGGETYAGISRNNFPLWEGWKIIEVAKSHESFTVKNYKAFSKYLSSILSLECLVRDFYKKEFWSTLSLDELSQELATELFEQSVNMGLSQTTKYLQRILNACNKDKLYEDILEDGVYGAKTQRALSLCLTKMTDEKILLRALNAAQAMHYINIASKKQSQRMFLLGWLKRT